MLSMADGLRVTIGAPLTPIDQREHEILMDNCRTELGNETFNEVWASGTQKPYQVFVQEILELPNVK